MMVAGSPDQKHWLRGCCDLTMRLGKVEAGVFLKEKFGHRRDARVKNEWNRGGRMNDTRY